MEYFPESIAGVKGQKWMIFSLTPYTHDKRVQNEN